MAKVLIVGAGLFGLTVGHLIRNSPGGKKHHIELREKRNHLGGNAWSYWDKGTSIEVHKYGSHIFHTNVESIWDFVRQFSSFSSYEHRVWSLSNNEYLSMPVNLATLSSVLGQALDPESAMAAIAHSTAEFRKGDLDSFEEKALAAVGRDLYERLFKGYTEKQWQTPPNLLPADVFSRLPIRFNFDNRYFTDKYQGIPEGGYDSLINSMVDSFDPSVEVGREYDFSDSDLKKYDLIIYTGPLDKFFNYRHGVLGWRTIDLELETLEVEDFQGTAVINYPDLNVPYTRIHEFKHFRPGGTYAHNRTIIAREYSRFAHRDDEPYYPINSPTDRQMMTKYRGEAQSMKQVVFGGRLGSYKYLDMHMAIGQAHSVFQREVLPRLN